MPISSIRNSDRRSDANHPTFDDKSHLDEAGDAARIPMAFAAAARCIVVLLLPLRFSDTRGIILITVGCAALTVVGYLIEHAGNPAKEPLLRCVVSVLAIGAAVFSAGRSAPRTVSFAVAKSATAISSGARASPLEQD